MRPLHPDDPARVGGYRLLGRLGEGGQGRVYLGRAPGRAVTGDEADDGASADEVDAAAGGPGRLVAIKALHTRDDPAGRVRLRLEAEADALGRILPFFTAQLIEARMSGDIPYLVTAFIDGPSLYQRVVRSGPLDQDALEALAAGTLTALIAVHDAGLVHHDVKPGNVLLGPDRPRLVDFGATVPAGTRSAGARSPHGVLTTPAFMAPELLGPGEVTPASDLFSWASTMTFAAAGRGPFHAAEQSRVVHRVEHNHPDLAGTPGTLRPVLRACLAKDPGDRPTAAGALDHLLRALGLDPRPVPDPLPAEDALADDGPHDRPDGGERPSPDSPRPIWEYATAPLELPA